MPMQELPSVLLSYGFNLKQQGEEYISNCIHCSAERSMSIYLHEEKWIASCHECGIRESEEEVILAFANKEKPRKKGKLTEETLIEKSARWKHIIPTTIPNMERKRLGILTKSWAYKLSDGQIIGYVAQYNVKGKKEYHTWTYGSYSVRVNPSWRICIWYGKYPIYNADKIKNTTGQVIIVNGEEVVDAVEKLFPNSCCTTWATYPNSVVVSDWSGLKGRKITLFPTSDPVSFRDMQWLAKHLLAVVGAEEVSSIDSSGQPLGWSLDTAVNEGWDIEKIIAWTNEHENSETLEYTNPKAAEKDLINRAKQMEKKTSELSVVPQLQTTSVESTPVEVKEGNVVSLQRKRLSTSPYLPEEFSEIALARSWSESHGKNWRYIEAWGQWMCWDNNRWEIDRKKKIFRISSDAMTEYANWEGAKDLTHSQRRAICSLKNMRNILSVASSYHIVLPEELDADTFLLGTPNGIINLRTGEFNPPSEKNLVTKYTAVSPKRGDMPVWESVLNRCTKGDLVMREYYQRWAGYMLTGDCREEGFLYLHGCGNSGKSKFVDCLGDMMGDYCTTTKIELLMESRFERHNEETANLAGARMVRSSEPEEGAKWNEAILKLLTGRDTISARKSYGKQFTFRPQFKLVISGNFRPSLKSTGEEIRRRMHFVEFPESIPEKDRILDLPERLRAEWPAILQWAIDGCLMWQRDGLNKPESVSDSTQVYLTDEDTMGHWLAECCETGKGYRAVTGDAYKSYKARAEINHEHVISIALFSNRLVSRGFGKTRTGSVCYLLGFKLK